MSLLNLGNKILLCKQDIDTMDMFDDIDHEALLCHNCVIWAVHKIRNHKTVGLKFESAKKWKG